MNRKGREFVASELIKAKEIVAKGLYFSSLEDALKSLAHTPVEHAWGQGTPKYREMKAKRAQIVGLIEDMLDEMPVPVDYLVVGLSGGQLRFDRREDLVGKLKSLGIKHTGESDSRGKKVMHFQPKFNKLIGPMYGGPKTVRYETQEAYDRLSR